MSPDYDLYVRRNTWPYALDPRVKLAFVAVAALLTFLWSERWLAVGVAAAVSAACVIVLLLSQMPPGRILGFLRTLTPLLVLVIVLTTLFVPSAGATWLRLGPVVVTAGGFRQGWLLAARLLALSFAFFAWLSTTDQGEMVRGFMALGAPYEWGLTLALALRYLPILAGLFEQVTEAQEARGLDLTRRGFRARLAAYQPILIAVVIGALRHGERLGWALEARGLGAANAPRTVYRPLKLRQLDLLAFAVLLLVAMLALVLRLA